VYWTGNIPCDQYNSLVMPVEHIAPSVVNYMEVYMLPLNLGGTIKLV